MGQNKHLVIGSVESMHILERRGSKDVAVSKLYSQRRVMEAQLVAATYSASWSSQRRSVKLLQVKMVEANLRGNGQQARGEHNDLV